MRRFAAMKRAIVTVLCAVFTVAALGAQAPGWKVRADRSTNASDPDAAGTIKFMSMGGGFHAVNPQAAVYWNPANAKQSYTYFLVAQNGSWLIKKRDGDANTSNVVAATMNEAVKKPGADGKSTNALEVRVGADKVDFVVNGT